jgi:hypothetical protein
MEAEILTIGGFFYVFFGFKNLAILKNIFLPHFWLLKTSKITSFSNIIIIFLKFRFLAIFFSNRKEGCSLVRIVLILKYSKQRKAPKCKGKISPKSAKP